MRASRALTLLCSILFCGYEVRAEGPKPLNVVLIVVDTLGAKHLGSYDSALTNSPRIDALATGGARFSQAYSTSSWTKPAVASILTSKLPSRHGVIGPAKKLPSEAETLPELFKAAGYDTIGVVSHTFLGPNTGFQQGFGEYYQLNDSKKVHSLLTSNLVSDQAIASLEKRAAAKRGNNFFLMLHYFDPHFRYQHHPELSQTSGYKGMLKAGMTLEKLERLKDTMKPEDIRYLVGLHREEIAFTDKHIGRVVDYLDAKGLRKNTLIVLTADHGEGFMEHGNLGHTVSLYEELVHVPLIFNLPGTIKPGVHAAPVSLLDITPSVTALLGRPAQSGWEGVSLAPALAGKDAVPSEREILMEVSYLGHDRAINPNIVALRTGGRKLIHDLNRNRWSLFDLTRDLREQSNLAQNDPEAVKSIGGRLAELKKLHGEIRRAPAAPGQEIEMPKEEVKKLKSLGYL